MYIRYFFPQETLYFIIKLTLVYLKVSVATKVLSLLHNILFLLGFRDIFLTLLFHL